MGVTLCSSLLWSGMFSYTMKCDVILCNDVLFCVLRNNGIGTFRTVYCFGCMENYPQLINFHDSAVINNAVQLMHQNVCPILPEGCNLLLEIV